MSQEAYGHQQRRHYQAAGAGASSGVIFGGDHGSGDAPQQRRHFGKTSSTLLDTSLVPNSAERPAWQVTLARSATGERTSTVGNEKLLTDEVGKQRRGGDAHYMTSYQRDMSGRGTPSDLRDAVGVSKPRRGRKPAPASAVVPPHLHLTCGGVVGFAHASPASRSDDAGLQAGSATAMGHVPGYSGHVSKANPEPFTEPRSHTHDKAFHLLPENYHHQVPGYTGRNMQQTRSKPSASRAEWQP